MRISTRSRRVRSALKSVLGRMSMSISGHRTRSTFDRYSITSGADQRKAMERVSKEVSS